MQTFVPYADFAKSAAVLDYRRLGKQRVEAYQIYRTLTGVSTGWRNHPATKMWAGHEDALMAYMHTCIVEWTNQGYKNTIDSYMPDSYTLPSWWGREEVHSSHRSNLLRKLPEYYNQYNWTDDPSKPYVWPV